MNRKALFSSGISYRRLFFIIILSFVGFCFFYLLLYGGHLFNGNLPELVRRLGCQANLSEIAKILQAKQIKLVNQNIELIDSELANLNLLCPSGKKFHDNETKASYKLITTQEGHVVVTEDANNHDTQQMKFTDIPYVRYCLYRKVDDPNSISLGCWEDKNVVFDAIRIMGKHR